MPDVNFPHYAQITFFIDVFHKMSDGSLSPNKLTSADLESEGVAEKAIFGVEGFTRADCIKKLKESLAKLKYDE